MAATTQHIVIRRPRPEVVAYMDDVSREREWQPSLVEASQTPEGPTRPGTRKHYVSEFLGRRVENTYVAKVVDPGRRVVYETTRDSTLRATLEIVWASEDDDRTRITFTMEGTPTGVLRFVPRGVLDDAWRRQLRTTLDRLKERLEAGA